MAGPTVVLTQSLYQGTHVSTALAWPAGTTTVTAAGTLSNTDLASVANTLNSFAVQVSFDGGKTFQQAASTAWSGNTLDKNGVPVPPGLGVSYATTFPTHARVSIDSPNVLSIGATLAFS